MSHSSNSRFKSQWGNLTDIGRMFDLSAVALGRRLKEMGLRSPDGMPVAAAIAEGLAMTQ